MSVGAGNVIDAGRAQAARRAHILVVDRALTPAFDPAPAVAHLLRFIEAGLGGRLPTDTTGTPSR